jgi:hypothetical protein
MVECLIERAFIPSLPGQCRGCKSRHQLGFPGLRTLVQDRTVSSEPQCKRSAPELKCLDSNAATRKSHWPEYLSEWFRPIRSTQIEEATFGFENRAIRIFTYRRRVGALAMMPANDTQLESGELRVSDGPKSLRPRTATFKCRGTPWRTGPR